MLCHVTLSNEMCDVKDVAPLNVSSMFMVDGSQLRKAAEVYELLIKAIKLAGLPAP
jgi:hypothetical protein